MDGAFPLQDDRIPTSLLRIQEAQRAQMPWQKFLTAIGWYRIQGLCTEIPPGFEAYADVIKADSCVPSQVDAMEGELDAERQSGEETQHAGPFSLLPILILSRAPASQPSNWPADVAKANSVAWNRMQEETKALSTHSRRIIAKGSDHYIQLDRPDLITSEVPRFIADIRLGKVPYLSSEPTVEQ